MDRCVPPLFEKYFNTRNSKAYRDTTEVWSEYRWPNSERDKEVLRLVTQKIYLSYACNGICEKSGTNTRARWRAGVWDIFAPYDHSLEPYVRIAVGDYIFLVENAERWTLLECLAHELTHYYQWLAEWEMNNVLEEKQARYCARQVVRRYWNEFFE